MTAVLFSMIGYFNGNNQTLWVMTQGLIQTLLVRLPPAYFMSIQPDASLTKIGLAAPVSTIVGIVLNIGYYIYWIPETAAPASRRNHIKTQELLRNRQALSERRCLPVIVTALSVSKVPILE